MANGMALAGRLDGGTYRVYVLLGDGEIDEGRVWEAAMAASHHDLDNVTAILDRNRQQIDDWTKDVMTLEPLTDKWRAFGWHVLEIDGHDMQAILKALAQAQQIKGKPTIIIAHTTKGKGVSFMECNLRFHGSAPSREEMEQRLSEIRTEERCRFCQVQYPGPC